MGELNRPIGSRIKQTRIEFEITQDELGKILDCTQQMVRNSEAAFCVMPVLVLDDFAILCKLPIDWFFMDSTSFLVYFVYLNDNQSIDKPGGYQIGHVEKSRW
jgi:DNA-binding XRE family transcriptional regulator